jgi:hypothetical protein
MPDSDVVLIAISAARAFLKAYPDQKVFLRSIAGRLAVVSQIISLKSRTLGDVMSGRICIGNSVEPISE